MNETLGRSSKRRKGARSLRAPYSVKAGALQHSRAPHPLPCRHAGAQELVEEQAELRAQLDRAAAQLRAKQAEEARRAAELEEVWVWLSVCWPC